ncbi:hypothetical protein DL991_10745 [Amycolatopsis sp. WAC 01375]|uniref:hypothetical protein n=1 Tax=Amycolatopsis sp. WAC 01375 TaxID=2203194 RepID=UPI000F7918BB|nr:hypothetical protein [Amycolatopsis sp. WAC 01375]RSM80580.1 hypothetical protein DL991_10745 [Amycolatopsis sp. WAC 01375]
MMTGLVSSRPPLLVLLRDEESGWAHVARQPQDPSQAPLFAGFLHATTKADLLEAMQSTGYTTFATIAVDDITTTYWFAPAIPSGASRRTPQQGDVAE